MELSHQALVTIAISLFLAVIIFSFSYHFRIPVIAPLLIVGILIGPAFLGLIDPSRHLKDGLKTIISLCIAVILFEGSLNLKISGYLQASKTIKKLLSIGVITTWISCTVLIYYIFNLSLSYSLLMGSLVIVTGPTVVMPLVRRIGLNEKLQHILTWEAILIDPIGVFIALLCFEWVTISYNDYLQIFNFEIPAKILPFVNFFERLSIGVAIGLISAYLIDKIIRKNIIPLEFLNTGILAIAVMIYAMSDIFLHESGLLSVTVAGLYLGHLEPPHLKQIKRFKIELTDLAIGLLFILLSARLNTEAFSAFTDKGIYLIAILIFLIRPLVVFISSVSSDLSINEKILLSWIAPRGIVAASLASIISIKMTETNREFAQLVETFVFSVIGCTVFLQGLTAGWLARVLKVKSPDRNGWMIIGINKFSIEIALFIKKFHYSCLMIDTDAFLVNLARSQGVEAFVGDALNVDEFNKTYYAKFGNVLALTDNKDLNSLLCNYWNENMSRHHLFCWRPIHKMQEGVEVGNIVLSNLPKPGILAHELENNISKMHTKQSDHFDHNLQKKNQDHIYHILSYHQGKFEFSQGDSFAKKPGYHLVIERHHNYLVRIIHDKHIVQLLANNFEELLTKMMQHVTVVHSGIPYEQTLAELLLRELKTPTLIGDEVAIPHSYCRELKESICIIGQLTTPLKMTSKQSIRLVFLLLSPPNQPKMHLQLLSSIARLISISGMVDKILNAENKMDILNCIDDKLIN